LVAAGVSFVSADYWDGYPDWASVLHGGPAWANHAEVTAWYCAPQLYWSEQHEAQSSNSYPPVTIAECRVVFTGRYHDEIRYNVSWHNYGYLLKYGNYNQTCTLARTYIWTYYVSWDQSRWWDTAIALVIAGQGPG
jgi:hypothetical protein